MVLFSISFLTNLFTLDENILNVNNEKVYFSINSHISYNYYNSDYDEYSRQLKNYYKDTVTKKDPNLIYRAPINIPLPDSFYVGKFDIKKGYSAVLIDSLNFFSFEISGFLTSTSIEGSGRSRVLFTVPDSLDFDRENLFLISKSDSVLDELKPCIGDQSNDLNVMIKIYRKLSDYFYHNKDVLERQMVNIDTKIDTENFEYFVDEIIRNFKLDIYNIDSGGFYIVGTCMEYTYHSFFAVMSADYKELTLNRHMHLYQSFKFKDDYYFYCNGYVPNTGANIYFVYKLVDNDLVKVFQDGSYSM